MPVDYLKGLADYWRKRLRLAQAEAKLNEFPQFTTEIDGQKIHFLHVRSPEADATPAAPPRLAGLVRRVPRCDRAAQPARPRRWPGRRLPPGHPVAARLRLLGPAWRPAGTAAGSPALAELMRRLGYQRYGAQGGDFGAFSRRSSAGSPPTT